MKQTARPLPGQLPFKAIIKIIEPMLPKLIRTDQTVLIKGRLIGQLPFKAIIKIIEHMLPKIIHTDQTVLIKGRLIGQNVTLLNAQLLIQ